MQYDLHVFDWNGAVEKFGSGEKFIEATFSDEGIGEDFWSFCHDRDADWNDSSMMHFEMSEMFEEFAQGLPDAFKRNFNGGIRKLITNDEQIDEFDVGEPSEIICMSMGSEKVSEVKGHIDAMGVDRLREELEKKSFGHEEVLAFIEQFTRKVDVAVGGGYGLLAFHC